MNGSYGLWLLRGTFIGASDPNADHAALHGFHTRGIALCPMATRPADPISGRYSLGPRTGSISWRMIVEGGSSTGAWQILTAEPRFLGSYGYNSALFRAFRLERITGMASDRTPGLNIFSLRGHTSIPVLLDATIPWPDLQGADHLHPGSWAGGGGGLNSFIMDRHGRQTNAIFLDWSIRKVGLKELYTLRWASDFNRAGPWTKAGGVTPEDWPEWMRDCKDY